MNINVSDGEPDRNTVRLERQIERANRALASAGAGYYVTDDELDRNPEVSKTERAPFRCKWI